MATWTVHTLPKSNPDQNIWTKLVSLQKSFRLQSLKTSPESFSSSYEREIAFPDEVWQARLQNPLAWTFVAVEDSNAGETGASISSATTLLEGEWMGSAVLYGPIDDPSERTNTVAKSIARIEFEIFGLFVLPDARGNGMGKALMAAATEFGKCLAKEKEAKELVVRISAAAGNMGAIMLYEKLGFNKVKRIEPCDPTTVGFTLEYTI